ncbi:ChaN family lipoprotein [Oceanidesulfovibrio marinus]|uniref:Iron-regulated protein n=1 Tax=Oceanidesulfovibrio marinus TaxID=370038 RepID=A0A6P1ZKX0_9BACT|nr:ChaN family lipoprotein [Oceanidesulfovibrio marinus]TVM36422.1 iron-regulated protein [Oceanidesulfovibrio marinus]
MRRLIVCLFTLVATFVLAGAALAQDIDDWDFSLWDVANGRELSIEAAVPDLAKAEFVYVGEVHDEYATHLAQLAVIRALREAGHEVVVGLEMFERRDQETLDRWLAGKLPEREFIEAFRRNWGRLWPQYRDIFLYCRENGVPMAGLNVPRSVTRKVASQGFESLTEEERGMLPPIACDVSPAYAEFLHRITGAHGHGEAEFQKFCEAQLVWDTAMAVHALDDMKEHPGAIMVVLAGSVHAWKAAMPAQMRKQDPDVTQRIILPQEKGRLDKDAVTTADCDYLMLNL